MLYYLTLNDYNALHPRFVFAVERILSSPVKHFFDSFWWIWEKKNFNIDWNFCERNFLISFMDFKIWGFAEIS